MSKAFKFTITDKETSALNDLFESELAKLREELRDAPAHLVEQYDKDIAALEKLYNKVFAE